MEQTCRSCHKSTSTSTNNMEQTLHQTSGKSFAAQTTRLVVGRGPCMQMQMEEEATYVPAYPLMNGQCMAPSPHHVYCTAYSRCDVSLVHYQTAQNCQFKWSQTVWLFYCSAHSGSYWVHALQQVAHQTRPPQCPCFPCPSPLQLHCSKKGKGNYDCTITNIPCIGYMFKINTVNEVTIVVFTPHHMSSVVYSGKILKSL